MNKKYTIRVSVPLDEDTVQRLRTFGLERGLSLASMVRMIVKEWLKNAESTKDAHT